MLTDDATFSAFARKVDADVQSVLTGYSISDRQTLREFLLVHRTVQMLLNDYVGAEDTAKKEQELEDKPDAKLTTGLFERALAAAQKDSASTSGPAFEAAFQRHYGDEVNLLPSAATQEYVKSQKADLQIVSPMLIQGSAHANLDVQVEKNGALDLESAERLLHDRWGIKVYMPLVKPMLAVLTPYVAAHNVQKPDIWAARDVDLTFQENLTPVNVAIFDSGVDTSLYPGQLFIDPKPGTHSPHGLAFDTQGNLYDGDLQPLTSEQVAAYPKGVSLSQGLDDLHNGIDSPAAGEVRQTLSHMPADQLASFLQTNRFLSQYQHGTHVAGIAAKGNPAIRLVVVQFNDGLAYLPFAPTVAWAGKFKANFRQVGEYFRDHNVQVVKMSWADSQGEIEQWLSKTTASQEPEARKQLASQIYAVWRDAVAGAIQAASETLWVCAAGNSNSNASFLGDVPASLSFPNLITVDAVDQAGDETSFTSYDSTVLLDANGFEVESFVPGGTKLRKSGTSMASPNVANLAAKLIALNPKLTPEQTIALMRKAADTSRDGCLHVIDPKATVALLHRQTP